MPEATNGQAMREAYEDLGLTREEFAHRVRLTPRSITNIAGGGVCSKSAAVRIAKVLGWNKNDLFAQTSDAEPGAATDGTETTTPAPRAGEAEEALTRGVA
jgi:DNA-binding XRE family transcriptional regulator